MKAGAAPLRMHVLAQSGLVGPMMPAAALAEAHCESENQPVQVTCLVGESAAPETMTIPAAQTNARIRCEPLNSCRLSGSRCFHYCCSAAWDSRQIGRASC